MFKKILPLIIVIVAAFVAGFALLHPGLPPTHDGEYHVVRFYEFDKILRDGNWYPRWASDLNHGFGVPLFNYVYPLPNYIASFLHLFNISFIDSFKLSMFIASMVGGIFMYLWAKDFWGEKGAIVSSVFYTFSPYHFVDMYIRGSVGEVWALGFFPAVLWSITMFVKKSNRRYFFLSSFFFALTIFSHNILALMFFPFVVSYAIFLTWKRIKLFLLTLLIFVFGISLSAIFWLPALLEKKYVVGLEVYDVFSNFPDLYQLLIPSWGGGFFRDDTFGNQMSVQIGLANLLVVLLGFIAFFVLKWRGNKKYLILLFYQIWFFILFFLMISQSMFVWENVPFMKYFQFPWRFLSLTILSCSFIAGSIPILWKPRLVSLVLIILTFSLGIGYAKPAYYLMRNDSYYVTRSNFIDGTNSPGNVFNTIWIAKKLQREKNKIRINQDIVINSESINTTNYLLKISAKKNTEMVVNTVYFPGWEILIDNDPSKVKNQNGLISVDLPKGEHEVIVKLGLTTVQRIALMVSFITVVFLVLVLFGGGNFVRI